MTNSAFPKVGRQSPLQRSVSASGTSGRYNQFETHLSKQSGLPLDTETFQSVACQTHTDTYSYLANEENHPRVANVDPMTSEATACSGYKNQTTQTKRKMTVNGYDTQPPVVQFGDCDHPRHKHLKETFDQEASAHPCKKSPTPSTVLPPPTLVHRVCSKQAWGDKLQWYLR